MRWQRSKHFVLSPFEHNALYRPAVQLAKQQGKRLTILDGALWDDDRLLESAEQAIRNGGDCFVLCHVSNVFGYIQPLELLDALLCRHGIPLILDASQSAGILPIDTAGLHSLQSACRDTRDCLARPEPVCCCGRRRSCSDRCCSAEPEASSETPEMPSVLPDRLESGTQNITGFAGLFEGMQFVRRAQQTVILSHERHTLMKTVDEYTEVVAQDIIEDVQTAEHRITGRLKAETDWHMLKKVKNGHYRKTIDPVSVSNKAGKSFHYAKHEQPKGGEHYFLSIGLENAGAHIQEWKWLFN